MRKFEITYFVERTPHTVVCKAEDRIDARAKFDNEFPTYTVYQIDEVDPDYDLDTLNLE